MNSSALDRSHHNAIAVTEDGYLVYNLNTRKLHRLNTTAALIFELCTGARSATDISNFLSPVLENNADSCMQWINFAISEELIELALTPALNTQPIKTNEVILAAEKLRADGNVLAAFVCQEHGVSLQSDKAEYWLGLGELAHITGRRERAREAYQQYLSLNPDNAEAELILQALMDNTPPARAPDECIRQLYSRFAKFYERNMCEELEYSAPEQLRVVMAKHIDGTKDLDILELGCGTGLAGKQIKPWAHSLIGVDLSPEMIEQSSAAGLYDELHTAEITAFLQQDSNNYHMVMACDTFIYFGDLNQVIAPATERLLPGGWLAFSVEKGIAPPYQLSDSGRYTHTEEHIRSAATHAKLDVLSITEGFLRYEYGKPVTGLFTLLRCPPVTP